METLWTPLMQGIGAAGLPAVLMAVAVWYLQKTNGALITQLNAERKDQLTLLSAHVAACDAERAELRGKLLDFAIRLGQVERTDPAHKATTRVPLPRQH